MCIWCWVIIWKEWNKQKLNLATAIREGPETRQRLARQRDWLVRQRPKKHFHLKILSSNLPIKLQRTQLVTLIDLWSCSDFPNGAYNKRNFSQALLLERVPRFPWSFLVLTSLNSRLDPNDSEKIYGTNQQIDQGQRLIGRSYLEPSILVLFVILLPKIRFEGLLGSNWFSFFWPFHYESRW